MKKITFMLVLLAFASTTFAGIKAVQGYSNTASFYQFTHDETNNTGDYHDYRRADQDWLGAQMIYLHIESETDVWVSNYIRSWYEDIEALDGNVYQMGETQYGAYEVNGDRVWKGTGESRIVTYNDDNNSNITNTTEAYYVGHFEGGETIALYMTTLENDGGETVDAMQYVYDAAHDTTLYSRVDGTHDLAGNVRVNFGLSEDGGTTLLAREFVAFGVSDNSTPSGQPLPGVLSTIVVACCSIACAKKMKKNK